MTAAASIRQQPLDLQRIRMIATTTLRSAPTRSSKIHLLSILLVLGTIIVTQTSAAVAIMPDVTVQNQQRQRDRRSLSSSSTTTAKGHRRRRRLNEDTGSGLKLLRAFKVVVCCCSVFALFFSVKISFFGTLFLTSTISINVFLFLPMQPDNSRDLRGMTS